MGLQDRQYYREEYDASPWSQAPSATQSIVVTLILINVGIFVLDLVSPRIIDVNSGQALNLHWLNERLALHSNVFQKPWLLWEVLSYGFAHASVSDPNWLFHIGGNMLVLFIFGRPVEQQLGRSEFLRFYLIAIVVAGLGWLLLNLNLPGRIVGASGAISAVVALFIFMFPHQTLLLMGIVPVKAWVLGVVVVVMDLLRSLDQSSPIAWEAHLTGFAFGAAYFFFKWNFQSLQFKKLSKPFKSRPPLKIHKPKTGEKIKQEADEILQKINDHGEQSLTARERKTLRKYSEQIRKTRD